MYEYDVGTYFALIFVGIFAALIIVGLVTEQSSLFGKSSVSLTDSNLEEYDKDLVNSKSKLGLFFLSFSPV